MSINIAWSVESDESFLKVMENTFVQICYKLCKIVCHTLKLSGKVNKALVQRGIKVGSCPMVEH